MQEYRVSTSAFFVTLTYDTDNVPLTRNGFMGLSKRDCQLFFKRLRKLNPDATLKYYLAGEYGGQTMRPHYHLLLFNAVGDSLSKAWSLGAIHVGAVTRASVGYTLKYMSKVSKVPIHRNDDRLPEFALMSKGLGANYISEAMVQWHKSDLQNRMYCAIEDGKKVSMPRYYKQKIYSEDERRAAGVSTRAKMLAERDSLELDPEYSFNRAEADIAAYKKMAHDERMRNKI